MSRVFDAFSGDEDDENDVSKAALNPNPSDGSAVDHGAQVPSRRRLMPSRRLWSDRYLSARICSMLCCVVIFSFIGVLASFLYIILKDLRSERTTTEDGTEVRLLGFWSIFVISSMAGLLCCSFSWTLTYFDSFEPGMFPPTPLSPARLRQVTGHSFHMGYSVALLNGVVAALTAIWCLV